MAPAVLHPFATYNTSTLPSALAEIRLDRGTSLGRARFRPAGDEVMPAIFATWNILDATMYARSRLIHNDSSGKSEEYVGRKHVWQTGYLREVQVRRMVQLVRRRNVRNYCEGA